MLPQFLNQYLFLILPALLLAAAAVWLLVKRWSWKWWLPWGGTLALLVMSFLVFKSPTATVSVVQTPPNDGAAVIDPNSVDNVAIWTEMMPIFANADAIRDYISHSDGKPTLVEFFSDFGLR